MTTTRFIDYLWGIETGVGVSGSKGTGSVYRLPMRNWNFNHQSIGGIGSLPFIDYLWGIETSFINLKLLRCFWFIDYLWGIETCPPPWIAASCCSVYRLPMRNWNRAFRQADRRGGHRVYRLPMRNWNMWRNTVYVKNRDGVYRLPMRNWNDHKWYKPCNSYSFIDYLWGIETFHALHNLPA